MHNILNNVRAREHIKHIKCAFVNLHFIANNAFITIV